MEATYQNVPIADFPGYFIDTKGVVRSERAPGPSPSKPVLPKKKRLKGHLHHTGYLFVNLYKDKKRHYRLIHRLVLEAFVGPCPKEGMETRHLNGVRTDNISENLKWGTHQENMTDKVLHGTSGKGKGRGKGIRNVKIQGEKHGRAKITDQKAMIIYKLKGTETYQFIADRFGVSVGTVYDIWSNRRWKHIH